MSDVIHSAVIEVGVDGSGVDAGMARIETAVARTGKTLENLGGSASAGLDKIGAGGEKASGTIDQATKKIIQSIERQTASMSAGAKGTVEYFAALGNARGANTEVLKPYLAQLDAVAMKTKIAAEAQQKLAEGSSFLTSLQARTDAISKSNSELLKMKAAQLGVAESAAPMIAKLKASEDAAKGAGGALGSLTGSAKTALLTLGAGFGVGAFVGMIRGSADAMDKLNDLSKTTKLTVETLSGLKLAAKQSGSDLDGTAASINKLAVNMGKDSEKFAAVGITAKDPIEAFKQLADVFNSIDDPQQRAAFGAEALGKSWASAAPLLAEGGKNIGDMIEKGKRLSGVTTEMAEAADKFNDQLAELETVSGRAKMKLASEMLPALTDVTKAVTEALDETGKLSAAWVALGSLGAFLFTDEFSSDLVKLKNIRNEVEYLKNMQEQSQTVPLLSWLLWGSKEAWQQEIDEKTRQINALVESATAPAGSKHVRTGGPAGGSPDAPAIQKFIGGKGDGKAPQLSEYDKLIKKLSTELTKAYGEAEAAQHNYNKAQGEFIGLASSDEWKKLTNEQRGNVASKYELIIAQQMAEAAGKKELEAQKDQVAFEGEMLAAKLVGLQALQTARDAAAASAQAEVAAAQSEYEQQGLRKSQIVDLTIATLELNAAKIDPAGFEFYNAELAAIRAQIDAKKQLAAILQRTELRDDISNAAKDAAQAWESAGDKIATSLEKSFGKGGKTAGDFLKTVTSGIAAQMKIDEKYAASKTGNLEKDSELAEKYQKQTTQNSIAMYGDMAGAAAGFFNEQSKGYQTLMGISRAFHIAEVAMQIAELAPRAANAILNQGNGDPYSAFARMAAMAAIVGAVMGSAGGSGGGGGFVSGPKNEGKGTVLGDGNAKSTSLEDSISLLADNSNIALKYSQDMLSALTSIKDNIGALSATISQTAGIRGTFQDSKGINSKDPGFLGAFSSSTELVDQGLQFGNQGTKITPGFESLIEGMSFRGPDSTAIDFTPQTVAQIREFGVSVKKFTDILSTNSGLWGIGSSSNTQTNLADVEGPIKAQLSRITLGIADAVGTAAGALGGNPAVIKSIIDGASVDLGAVSLKGKTGKEVAEELQAVYGAFADGLAEKALPAIVAFEKVGEGGLATLTRVLSGTERAGLALDHLGIKAIDFTEVINKQGDVMAEISRQSIVRAESKLFGTGDESTSGIGKIIQTFTGSGGDLIDVYTTLSGIRDTLISFGVAGADVTAAMIAGANGLDEFDSGIKEFFDKFFTNDEKLAAHGVTMSASFEKLGIAMPTTSAGFRKLVTDTELLTHGTDEASTNAQNLYGHLIALSGGFADFQAEQAAAAAKTQSLRIQIMELEGNSVDATAAKRKIELDALSAGDQLLQMRIYALQDEAAALAKANAVSAERFSLESQYASLKGDNTLSRIAELQTIDPANRALKLRIWALQAEQTAAKNATQGSHGVAAAYNDATKAQNDYLQGLVNFGKSIKEFLLGLDQDKSLTPAARLDNARSQYQKDLELSKNGTDAQKAEAQARLVKDSQTYLEVARENFGHGGPFSAILGQIKSDLGGLDEVKNLDANLLALEAIKNAIASSSSAAQSTGASIAASVDSVPFAITEANLKLIEGLKDQFKVLDTDLSGGLTRVEFGVGLAGQASEAAIDALFQLTDTNHDGIISAIEAQAASTDGLAGRIALALHPDFDSLTEATGGLMTFEQFREEYKGTGSEATLRAIFNSIDANGSGTIDAIEAGNANTAATKYTLDQYAEMDNHMLYDLTLYANKTDQWQGQVLARLQSAEESNARLLEQIKAGQSNQTSTVANAVVTTGDKVASASNKAAMLAVTS
ncbi:hypothetical protein BH11PSE11_BH11PSE11_12350 [soil metagenome]